MRNSGFIPTPDTPYYTLSRFMKERFGGKVRKISIDAGFSCPNRDGGERRGGCFWCDPDGSGPGERARRWEEFLRAGTCRLLDNGYKGSIAYFQAFTNTLGETAELREMYEKALSVEGVLGIAIGTRPDCLSAETLDMLAELNEKNFIWVEIGMQSMHDATLALCNRGHSHSATKAGVAELQKRGIKVVLHLIAGLPGESEEMMKESFAEAARLKPWGVKLHPLHVVRGSRFEKWFYEDKLKLLDLQDYARLAAELIEMLDRETVVHRITGERPAGILIAPGWCLDKEGVKREILGVLSRNHGFQGRRSQGS